MRPQLKIAPASRDYYVVVQLPNPKKLGWEGRWFVRLVLMPLLRLADRVYDYSATGEIQAVKTDREQAENALEGLEKGVAYPVPVDSDLPLKTVRYGQPIYSEDLKRRYADKPPCPHVSVKRCDLEILADANVSMTRRLAKIGVKGT
jgi:hypothetical protein